MTGGTPLSAHQLMGDMDHTSVPLLSVGHEWLFVAGLSLWYLTVAERPTAVIGFIKSNDN